MTRETKLLRYYDPRNKASHEVAEKLKAVVENECLPYI